MTILFNPGHNGPGFLLTYFSLSQEGDGGIDQSHSHNSIQIEVTSDTILKFSILDHLRDISWLNLLEFDIAFVRIFI